MPRRRREAGTGTIRQLPSGRYQAIFRHDGERAVKTVDTKAAAQLWLKAQTRALANGTWTRPSTGSATVVESKAPRFGDYSEQWLQDRNLRPKTDQEYRRLLKAWVLPTFRTMRLDTITVEDVKTWYRTLPADKPTQRARAYSLLRSILQAALQDDVIAANPARIRGAGQVKRATKTEVPTPQQIQALADHMAPKHPTHTKYRLLILTLAYCGLRFGEATELRRGDILTEANGTPIALQISRAVVHVKDEPPIVGPPKTEAGIRQVTIPPHIRGDLAAYLHTLPDDPAQLIFPGLHGQHMRASTLQKVYYEARKHEDVGLPHLRVHDLRHFAASLAAASGTSLASLQARLGHASPAVALRYQHPLQGEDEAIAAHMSNVVVLPVKVQEQQAN